jgi:hypothetical protein
MAKAIDCAVIGCDSPRSTRGWCMKHYAQWKRTGDPISSRDRPAPTLTIVRRPAVEVPGAATRVGALRLAVDAYPDALLPENSAALDVALYLAAHIDTAVAQGDVETVDKLTPKYLAALREMGLTPGARKPKVAEPDRPVLRDVSAY